MFLPQVAEGSVIFEGGRVRLPGRPLVMGVLNVTPDSFSDGGALGTVDDAVAQARRMAAEGATILDVGGESTRPGADPVSLEEELARVVPVIERIRAELPDIAISIDTSKPQVMRAAVAAGACLINDVFALRAPGAVETVVDLGVPVCLMHMQGEPRTMQDNPRYEDVVEDVRRFLLDRAQACLEAGIARERILVDPGFGFGKSPAHNLELLRRLDRIVETGFPVLVGLSRKSMIGAVLGRPVGERLYASIALAALAAWQGAAIVRVHDVRATADAIGMVAAIRNPGVMEAGAA